METNVIGEEISAFRRHLTEEEKSENTVVKYLRDVRAWQEWCDRRAGLAVFAHENDRLARRITKESVIAYKKHLLESGYSKRSINSMLCSVNAFLAFSGRPDCKVKLLKIQREVFSDGRKELTKPEFDRLCAAALSYGNRRLYMLLQTLCGTGIRVSELQFVTVEAVRNGKAVVTLKGKTRTVFFVSELRKKLLVYAKGTGITSGQIFVTKTGKPMSRTNIWREMKNLCKKAKVDESKVFPHNLRHLFAKVFYAVKKDIAKLADVLGHASIETTRIYIAATGTEHRRIMENMHLIC